MSVDNVICGLFITRRGQSRPCPAISSDPPPGGVDSRTFACTPRDRPGRGFLGKGLEKTVAIVLDGTCAVV